MIQNTEQALGNAGRELTDVRFDLADTVSRRDNAMDAELHARFANLGRSLRALLGLVSALTATIHVEDA